ncbi:cell division topological specificity factor MinE [Labrys wisconsinensis]|uniref:Cell division topological specificity factor n=1 Tax=Labrys wisconsinensis TaxID=425677 RepID=A0ABU0JIP5_9HYPH|nr:cell division topological specificity factor MinE [Labrys wisconsinensis]MDQ0474156.1 cell division topological specificity factor [Labrys wisconsinensis]
MNVLNFFGRRKSAPVARERLQILLAHERSAIGSRPDLLNILREEILAVVGKHVAVDSERVHVKMNRGPAVSTLEIDIEIPNVARAKIAVNM